METIKARVHDATIDKVAQFFDAEPFTVIQELLQNARRSGATLVAVTDLDDSMITISDNGHGIPNPQSVLDFGRSEWSGLDHENPAGMGFFALARYRIAITSRPAGDSMQWHARINPEHFAGKEAADVIRTPRDADSPDGTTITITHNPNDDFNVEFAAFYFPLPVTLNGKALQREPFLAAAVSRTTFEGVEIGIFKATQHLGWNLNFHGVRAKSPGVDLLTDPRPNGYGTSWSAAYDVNRSPELELVLPTRETIVHNAFSERLMKAATHFLLETVRRLRPNAVVGRRAWLKSRSAGFTFPQPEPKLEEWQPSARSQTRLMDRPPPATLETGPDSLVFLANDIEAGDRMALYRALRTSGATNILRPHPEWTGYPWYDAIPKIRTVRILVEDDGTTRDLTTQREARTKVEDDSRVDSITFEMTAVDEAGRTRTIPIPGDVAFAETCEELAGDMPTVLLTKASDLSTDSLEEMIIDGFFQISEDTEDDSPETQIDRFTGEARFLAIAALESADEARNDSLRHDIQQLLQWRLIEGERIVIARNADGLKVDIQPVDAGGRTAAGN